MPAKKKLPPKPERSQPRRLVVSISTQPEKLEAMDALIAGLDKKAAAHIDRSRVIAALFEVLQDKKRFIRAHRIVDRASLKEELTRALERKAPEK
jgi:hypothetical protein